MFVLVHVFYLVWLEFKVFNGSAPEFSLNCRWLWGWSLKRGRYFKIEIVIAT